MRGMQRKEPSAHFPVNSYCTTLRNHGYHRASGQPPPPQLGKAVSLSLLPGPRSYTQRNQNLAESVKVFVSENFQVEASDGQGSGSLFTQLLPSSPRNKADNMLTWSLVWRFAKEHVMETGQDHCVSPHQNFPRGSAHISVVLDAVSSG